MMNWLPLATALFVWLSIRICVVPDTGPSTVNQYVRTGSTGPVPPKRKPKLPRPLAASVSLVERAKSPEPWSVNEMGPGVAWVNDVAAMVPVLLPATDVLKLLLYRATAPDACVDSAATDTTTPATATRPTDRPIA
jgi:hypothetical protein